MACGRAEQHGAFAMVNVGSFRVVGTSSSVVPIAESPSAGMVIAGGSAAPVLSWSLPVETNAALTFDVEVASNEAMSGAEVFAGVASAQVVLARLSAGPHFWRVRSKTATGEVSEYSDVETLHDRFGDGGRGTRRCRRRWC